MTLYIIIALTVMLGLVTIALVFGHADYRHGSHHYHLYFLVTSLTWYVECSACEAHVNGYFQHRFPFWSLLTAYRVYKRGWFLKEDRV